MRENERKKRKWGEIDELNREEMSLCLHFPPLSPFHHSITISPLSPFPHSLPISSQPSCKAAAGCDSLQTLKHWKWFSGPSLYTYTRSKKNRAKFKHWSNAGQSSANVMILQFIADKHRFCPTWNHIKSFLNI